MILPREVENIIRLLKDNTHDAYIVGGCVRDALLGRTPNDWDITTDAKPQEIKKIFRKTIDTGIEHGTVTVLMNGSGYEVTTYRVDGDYSDHRRPDSVTFTDNLIEDLKRRDFTINAMAYNHERGIVDEFGGQEDLKTGLVRCVGNPNERFTEDALRILRAIRFSAQLGFEIEKTTQNEIGHHAPDLPAVSAERILTELNKTINSAHPEKLQLIWDLGLENYISKNFKKIKNASGLVPGYKGTWAALMRDNTVEEADEILRELKSDNDTRRSTMALVAEYKNPLPQTEADIRHVLNRIGPELFDTLMDMYASAPIARDSSGCDSDSSSERVSDAFAERKSEISHLCAIKEAIIARGDAYTLSQLAITGNDLISLGHAPGPALGHTLNNLLEEVIEDPALNTRENLLARIAR